MRRLIVDGYNVLHADDRYRRLAEQDLDTARARLVEDVAAFSAGEWHATVVFDGGGNAWSDGAPHHVAGVSVMFSREGESADSVIEALASRSRERGERVTIVTSDAATQWTVMRGEVVRVSSAEFIREVRDTGDDWMAYSPAGARKGTVQERIDDDVRSILARWARGRVPDEH